MVARETIAASPVAVWRNSVFSGGIKNYPEENRPGEAEEVWRGGTIKHQEQQQ